MSYPLDRTGRIVARGRGSVPYPDWKPGDPVHAPQPEWVGCRRCASQVLWTPNLPDEIQCPECDGVISTRAEAALDTFGVAGTDRADRED